MAINPTHYESPVKTPRGNDQSRENNHPGNALAGNSENTPFLLDEGEDIVEIITGKISSRIKFDDETGGTIHMEGLNSESELNKKIKQDAEKSNIYSFERKDNKQ